MRKTNAIPYQFANLLWTDKLRSSTSGWITGFNVAAYSLAPWLLGAVIAEQAGRLTNYLNTPIFYVGSLGIALTLGALMYGSKKHLSVYRDILECFDLSDDERKGVIHDILDRYYNSRRHLLAAAIVFSVGVAIAVLGFWYWEHIRIISDVMYTSLPRFTVFRIYGWYDKEIASYSLAIVVLYAMFIALPLGTSTSVMIRMPISLWKISKLRPLLPPLMVKSYFSDITSLYTRISISWLFGAFMMFYFFGLNDDVISYAIAFIFFILGVFTFFIPQVVYVKVVSGSEDRYFETIRSRLFGSGDELELVDKSTQQSSDLSVLI